MKTFYFLIIGILLSLQVGMAQSRLVIENLKTGKKFSYNLKTTLAIQTKTKQKWIEGFLTSTNHNQLTITSDIETDTTIEYNALSTEIEIADIQTISPRWNRMRGWFNVKKIFIGGVMFIFSPLSLNDKYGTNWYSLAGFGAGGSLLFTWGLLDNKRLDKKTQDFSAKHYKFYLKN